MLICDTLRDLVPFVQIKKRDKHSWRSVTFTKSDTPPWVFSAFFKLYKWYQIAQRITINISKKAKLNDFRLVKFAKSESVLFTIFEKR